MSLINDALKQAKAAQPTVTAPAEGPALRPVERERRPDGTRFLLPALVAVILALAVTLLWIWFHGAVQPGASVRARTVSDAVNVAPAPAIEPARQVVAAPTPAQVKPVEPAALVTGVPAATAISNTTSNVTETTNTVIAKPEPPIYKLQAIFYNPRHPSAMISGKTVSVGDQVKGAKVISIQQEAVTIVTPTGETKVMELN
ncbi:hypothetical protein [Pedosphaera parvula]|uniref:Uncharacterized protein n=1 Tax=Pedosphaera parvula (strain Ellin514) TaxID=320771 RepID=B9XSU3_PEDPL|nr:hypothetical protein [Pedosphaera parvula]EEF57080.1 hypothetical protein Cflav_PD0115 [Pedosphaera parvula Ellin514]